MKMKFVALLICALIAISHQEEFTAVKDDYEALIGPIKRACVSESNADVGLVDRLIADGAYVDDRPLKCYLRCLYLKLGMLNEAGEINQETMKKNVGVPDEAVQEKVYQKCKGVTGADLCEKAFNLSKCTYETVQQITKG